METLESQRYQLTEAEETIAACLGHAYAHALGHRDNPESRVEAVWDMKDRVVLEFQLERPKFNRDTFIERIQHHFERASGL